MTFTPTPFRDDGRANIKDWWNILLFVVLTLGLGLAFDRLVIQPRALKAQVEQQKLVEAQKIVMTSGTAVPAPRAYEEVIKETPRFALSNAHVQLSLSATGLRLDDLALRDYKVDLGGTEPVRLMVPAGTEHPFFGETGWIAGQKDLVLPESDTIWIPLPGATDKQISFEWKNEQGLIFTRVFELDERFGVRVTDRVRNESAQRVQLWPYALLSQHGLPEGLVTGIVHEGAVGYIGDEYVAFSYAKWKGLAAPASYPATGGWIGTTSRYFFTGLLPDQKEAAIYRAGYRAADPVDVHDQNQYQVDVQGAERVIEPGASTEFSVRVYAGPKTLRLLESYEKDLGLRNFDLAVDFGWFYFLTKPFYYALVYLNDFTGNFGVAILLLTFLLRLAVFPLANTSFRSFAKMKKVQPQIQELQKQYIHDKKKMQEELVKLYTKEKVNPVSGCLPIIAQIPIFFAMYKVISVAIEMRHAPFFGWIHDLSAPDPTSLFNLFGLLPYEVPTLFHFGIWPFCLFILIMIQVRLSPPPADKMMQVFFNYYYPVVVCFIMARFAAGLVIYWGFSALFSIVQQVVIMQTSGVPVHLFERIKSKTKKETA